MSFAHILRLMLPVALNLSALAGLTGSAYIASRLSSQGRMHLKRLWIMPAVGILTAIAVHRPLEATPFGFALLAAGLVIGITTGWLRGRGSLLQVDLNTASFVTRRGRRMPIYVVGIGLLALLASNLYGAQMLRLLNGSLLLQIASDSSQRLYLLWAWFHAHKLRARNETPALDTAASEHNIVMQER